MSINVTVNGNPVSIHRGRMVLSDLDQIKKNERDRRRRLRLEQVRQQSKEISNRLLERAKTIAQRDLSNPEKDVRLELKQMHDRKIMEIQRKYQEDMEDIGQAHLAATHQPDVAEIIESEKRKNRAAALERGREAAQKLRDAEMKEDLRALQQERLKKVREIENARAAAVFENKQLSSNIEEKSASNSSPNDNPSVVSLHQKSPSKTKVKKLLSKKSPIKVITKSNVKVVSGHSKITSPSLHRKSKNPELKNQTGSSGSKNKNRVKEKIKFSDLDYPKTRSASKSSPAKSKLPQLVTNSDSDIEEMEESVPVINVNIPSSKSVNSPRYNPEDYRHDSLESSSDSSSSSSISEDSSYFSDAADTPAIKRTPKHHNTPSENKVQMYDYNTRQRNAYNRPTGIVERIDIRNEPNAKDMAREILETESVNTELLKNRQTNAERRGQDALLRERVRRDYQTLLQNLDHLSREERKLKASQIHEPPNLHMSPTRRKDFQMKRQRKMNRALEGILRTSEDPPYTLTEKFVTLKPREDPEEVHILPEVSWQHPPFQDTIPLKSPEKKDSLDELSREEQILELLQKVERQKRILLREFGASLPPEVFSSSRKPENSKPGSPSKAASVQRPPSPEIRVINMSSHEDDSRPKIQGKKKVPQQSEIAVQTSTIENDSAEDKGVQVELTPDSKKIPSKDKTEALQTNEGISEDLINKISNQSNIESQRQYPLEPVVKIIAADSEDSSSGSSIITDLVISFDKKQIQVTPKRKKKGTLKISRKTSPMISVKSRSAPGSKTSKLIKKSSHSAPSSRLSTPKKPQQDKGLEGRHDFEVNRGFRAEIDSFGGMTVDSSTESSQIYSAPDNGTTGQVYQIHTRSSKKTIRIKDTSDASTSYASPPTAQAAAFLKQGVLQDTTPILELLDSAAIDALHVKKSQISPVSTPETPSPRTMRLPSNVPNPDKISKMLRFNQMEEGIKRGRKNQTTSTDQGRQDGQRLKSASPRSQSKSIEKCNCNNPNCKLHEDSIDINSQTLKNCPEIQKLYEELENVCSERIASLSDLIKKLRNEQKVLPPSMDFSLATPNDDTSFLQLSSGNIPRDLRDVRNLVENVEAINNQLARTLQESRRIIASEGADLPKPPLAYSQIEKSPELSDSKSKESMTSSIEEDPQIVQEIPEKGKPKLISSESVNLNIDKFRIFRSPPKMQGQNREANTKNSKSGHEDMVEQISKEILEQSKSLDKSSGLVTLESLKETDSYLAMRNEFNFDEIDSFQEKTEKTISPRKISKSPEEKNKDFVPLLAGIPKTPRALPSSSIRGRPPVSLVSGHYRPNLASPVHELSTIVEFDTPDTANRSQTSVKSSASKAKRNLATDLTPSPVSPSKKSDFRKPLESSLHKNSNTSKPSVHVAPLPAPQTPQSTPRRSSTNRSPTQLFSNDSQIPRRQSPKKLDAFKNSKVSKSDSTDSSEQKAYQNGNLELDTIRGHENLGSKILKFDDLQKKLTSTSSNSFSALSGISEIASTPTSDLLKCASSPEEMERTLKKFGLDWAITTLKKTREASALSSSSNSDTTPINTARRIISPFKRQAEIYLYGLPDFSDVSSISIKEASKSTERAVLMKARTSTPNILISNSDKSGSTTASSSSISFKDPNDSLIVPNLFLSHGKKNRTKQTKPS